MSISNHANADGCIAVGSVHKGAPHKYGVSYLSSKGLTADGRNKPDLVAPGEKDGMPARKWESIPLGLQGASCSKFRTAQNHLLTAAGSKVSCARERHSSCTCAPIAALSIQSGPGGPQTVPSRMFPRALTCFRTRGNIRAIPKGLFV